MGDRKAFERAIYLTKLSVYLIFVWPISRYSTKSEILKFNILWAISLTLTVCSMIPLACSVYVNRHDIVILATSVCTLSAVVSLLMKMVLSRVQRAPLQILIEEMENLLNIAMPHEEIVFERYVRRFLLLHKVVFGMMYMGGTFLFIKPLILIKLPFPFYAIYPFNVDSGIVRYLIFINHSITCVQVAASTSMDGQAALLMWFAGARLEIFSQQITNIDDITGFKYFVRKHKELMFFADRVSNTACNIVLISYTNVAVTAIAGALVAISDTPLLDKISFGVGGIGCLLVLSITASPADNLHHVCELLEKGVYDTSWTDMSMEIKKSLLIVLQRCQRPITVSVSGFMPALTLNFYAKYLSSMFSYFTTLRAFMTS